MLSIGISGAATVKASTEIDPRTLTWIKQEITESLNGVRQSLETFVESGDRAVLAPGVEIVHRVLGALEMIELTGPVYLAREIEIVLARLADDKIEMKKEAAEVLMRGILQLPAYLEQLYHGRHDVPLVLLPLLNDLRAVQNKELLTEGAFFFTDIDVRKPSSRVGEAERATWDQRTMAKKLRPAYLAALLGVFRELELARNLKVLATVIMNIEQASTLPKSEQVWWVSAGLVQSVQDRGLELSVAVKLLLGRIDRQIKRLISDGEAALNAEPPQDLIKNMLYYLSRSTSQAARVLELRKSFKLEQTDIDNEAIDTARDDLVGFNANLMTNVSAQIKEELLRIKDDMDLAMNANRGDVATLAPVCERLHTVADTLEILGMKPLAKLAREQRVYLQKLIDDGEAVRESEVLHVAGALLYIESSLYDLNVKSSAEFIDGTGARGGTQMAEAEFRELVKIVVTEALTELARFKDAFARYVADPQQPDTLQDAPAMLETLRGVLTVLGHDRPARIIEAGRMYLVAEIAQRQTTPSERVLDLFANVIGAVEYFFESLVEKAVAPETALDLAERSLADLGYAVRPRRSGRDTATSARDKSAARGTVSTFEPVAAGEDEETPEDATVPVDEELLEVFLSEAGDELTTLRTQTDRWKNRSDDAEALQILVRSFHTLKGAGRIIGANPVSVLAWSLEELLRRVQDGRVTVNATLYGLLDQVIAAMGQIVEAIRRGESGEDVSVQYLIDTAREMRQPAQAAGASS